MISNPDPSPNPDPEPNPYPNTNSTHSPCTLTNRLDSNTFVFFLVTSNQNHPSMCVSIFIIFNQSWGLQPSAPSFILNSQCLCCTTGFLALPRRAYVYTKVWSNLFFVLCAHEPRDKLLVWTHVHIMEANVPKSKWIYDKAKSPARQYNRPCLLAFLQWPHLWIMRMRLTFFRHKHTQDIYFDLSPRMEKLTESANTKMRGLFRLAPPAVKSC